MIELNASAVESDAVFSIGSVFAVEGRRVKVRISKLKNGSHLLFRGQLLRNVSVGSFVKIAKGFNELVAVVDAERVDEDDTVSTHYRRSADNINRELQVSLVGYFEGRRFQRGVREMPLLGNECFLLSEDEFRAIHTYADTGGPFVTIGVLANEATQEVSLGIDAIFASHIGIFGNTGSGKSYTLAKLYHELFNKPSSFGEKARFVLIDFNGEYVDREDMVGAGSSSSSVIVGADKKAQYVLSTRNDGGEKIPLPQSVVNDHVFWTVLLDATEKTQAPFLKRVLESSYWDNRMQQAGDLPAALGELVARATKTSDNNVDRQTVVNLLREVQICLGSFASQELGNLIEEFRERLQYHSKQNKFYWQEGESTTYSDAPNWGQLTSEKVADLQLNVSSLTGIDLVRFKIILQYYNDIISGFANREHLSPLIKRLETRVPDIKKLIETSDKGFDRPLSVVCLRDVNLAMRKVIPMLLCKHLYDSKKEGGTNGGSTLNLIIDEAHNILSMDSSRESELWRDYRLETFEEIIKEGRKFGVFLTVASQRPHDISPTIISQLHNYFLHRLVNNRDIEAIEKAVSYLDRVSFESLPILPTGVCIFSGVAAKIPVMIEVNALEPQFAPNSHTPSLMRQ